MTEWLIEERWAKCKPNTMEKRLDTLRLRAEYLREKIDRAPIGTRRRDEREHAALMWAIAELSGIGEEVRRERSEREHATASMYRKAMKRADEAESMNIQYRIKIQALKAEVYRLVHRTPNTESESL